MQARRNSLKISIPQQKGGKKNFKKIPYSRFLGLTSSLKTLTPAAALLSAVTDLFLPFNSSNLVS